jgi:hypothetical protein
VSASGGSADRLAGLRDHAARKREETVRRVEAAIAALHEQQRPVTAAAIENRTGIGFTALKRNAEAYAAFVAHSTRLRARREQPGRRRSQPLVDAPSLPRPDPLLQRKKAWLVGQLHAARAAHDLIRAQYHALLQEHLRWQAEQRGQQQERAEQRKES